MSLNYVASVAFVCIAAAKGAHAEAVAFHNSDLEVVNLRGLATVKKTPSKGSSKTACSEKYADGMTGEQLLGHSPDVNLSACVGLDFCKNYFTKEAAQKACDENPLCKGVLTTGPNHFELRAQDDRTKNSTLEDIAIVLFLKETSVCVSKPSASSAVGSVSFTPGNIVAFKWGVPKNNGRFVPSQYCYCNDKGIVKCDAPDLSDADAISIEDAGEGFFAFKGPNGKYWSHDATSKDQLLKCTEDTLTADAKYKPGKKRGNTLKRKGYCTNSDSSKGIKCNRGYANRLESFTVEKPLMPTTGGCYTWGHPDKTLEGCANENSEGCVTYESKEDAEDACNQLTGCSGITRIGNDNSWEIREGRVPNSQSGATSYLKQDCESEKIAPLTTTTVTVKTNKETELGEKIARGDLSDQDVRRLIAQGIITSIEASYWRGIGAAAREGRADFVAGGILSEDQIKQAIAHGVLSNTEIDTLIENSYAAGRMSESEVEVLEESVVTQEETKAEAKTELLTKAGFDFDSQAGVDDETSAAFSATMMSATTAARSVVLTITALMYLKM